MTPRQGASIIERRRMAVVCFVPLHDAAIATSIGCRQRIANRAVKQMKISVGLRLRFFESGAS